MRCMTAFFFLLSSNFNLQNGWRDLETFTSTGNFSYIPIQPFLLITCLSLMVRSVPENASCCLYSIMLAEQCILFMREYSSPVSKMLNWTRYITRYSSWKGWDPDWHADVMGSGVSCPLFSFLFERNIIRKITTSIAHWGEEKKKKPYGKLLPSIQNQAIAITESHVPSNHLEGGIIPCSAHWCLLETSALDPDPL